ncbi:MAG: hypothetical protein LUG66_10315 [Clostridiales bacterium]|nr:hypothetical protein [Clostridiales bacterium]
MEENSVNEVKACENRFSKEALVKSKLFREQRDILSAVLKDGEDYSKEEAQKLIKNYLEKEMA